MTPEQMIEAQASVMAVDALNAGYEAVRALADNTLALPSTLRIVTARAEAAETELAAVPWRAIAHMLDNVATDEDRQTVALWHLAKWGF